MNAHKTLLEQARDQVRTQLEGVVNKLTVREEELFADLEETQRQLEQARGALQFAVAAMSGDATAMVSSASASKSKRPKGMTPARRQRLYRALAANNGSAFRAESVAGSLGVSQSSASDGLSAFEGEGLVVRERENVFQGRTFWRVTEKGQREIAEVLGDGVHES